jgi:hypothetical protein
MRDVVYHPCVPNEVRELVEYDDGISTELGNRFWGDSLLRLSMPKSIQRCIISTIWGSGGGEVI